MSHAPDNLDIDSALGTWARRYRAHCVAKLAFHDGTWPLGLGFAAGVHGKPNHGRVASLDLPARRGRVGELSETGSLKITPVTCLASARWRSNPWAASAARVPSAA
jgi:hypothetical protein